MKYPWMAVASLVLGIASLLSLNIPYVGWVLAIVGLVFGIIALKQTSKSKDKSGKIMAIGGIIFSGLGLITLILALFSLAYFGFSQPKLVP